MRYLTLKEALELHQRLIQQSGGLSGIRDLGALQSSLAQPLMTFGGEDLYPSIIEKAAALCFSLVMNHPFLDGNKRAGHAVMETFLLLNGYEIVATVNEQERLMLEVAAGQLKRDHLTEWLKAHVTPTAL